MHINRQIYTCTANVCATKLRYLQTCMQLIVKFAEAAGGGTFAFLDFSVLELDPIALELSREGGNLQ